MGQPRPLLFIFVLFKHKFYRKTVDVSRIRTRIVRVEVEHADHLTTTTAHFFYCSTSFFCSVQRRDHKALTIVHVHSSSVTLG